MTGDRARSALAGTRFSGLRWVAETGSTNVDLLESARTGAPDGAVLVADHQTAGRGRLGRTWEAPAGASLLCSILFRPTLAVDDLHLLTTAVGVATVDALQTGFGVRAGMKWPNDLVAGEPERKLAGILAESVAEGERIPAVVVGMGINVAWGDEVPAELQDIAVALDHLGHVVDREDLLAAILLQLEERLPTLADPGGRAALHEDHRARCVTLGRTVRVELPDGVVEGRATDLLPSGHLVVDPGDGTAPVEISVGDVIHLR